MARGLKAKRNNNRLHKESRFLTAKLKQYSNGAFLCICGRGGQDKKTLFIMIFWAVATRLRVIFLGNLALIPCAGGSSRIEI